MTLAALLMASLGQLLTAPPAAAATQLSAGQFLIGDKFLVSADGRFKFGPQQWDGNLVLYQRISGSWRAIWSARVRYDTSCQDASLNMQEDGNLVLYHYCGLFRYTAWASNTVGGWRNTYLYMQNDGNAVLYRWSGPSSHPVWATNTCCR